MEELRELFAELSGKMINDGFSVEQADRTAFIMLANAGHDKSKLRQIVSQLPRERTVFK